MSLPAGRGGVQHREGPSGADSEAEDHGVLREEREADRAAEENVSRGKTSHAANTSLRIFLFFLQLASSMPSQLSAGAPNKVPL